MNSVYIGLHYVVIETIKKKSDRAESNQKAIHCDREMTELAGFLLENTGKNLNGYDNNNIHWVRFKLLASINFNDRENDMAKTTGFCKSY